MRIYVHDYCGHPFPVQLSRWLVRRGHAVRHAYSADFEAPRGGLACVPDAQTDLSIASLSIGVPLAKYDPVRRLVQETRYGRVAARDMAAFAPDVVLSGQATPPVQRRLLHAAHRRGARFVYWLQDIISLAAAPVLVRRFGLAGRVLSARLSRNEFRTLAAADRVVVITEDFLPICVANGVRRERIDVIENWAPLDEILPAMRDNAWARQHGLTGKFVFLYSGTLGLKHNPALLSDLAASLRGDPTAQVVVIARGPGRDRLAQSKRELALDNLLLLDYQPYEHLSSVLASADVLLAVLEPYAGVLSVPSKVLSYLCAERPILAAVPSQNLAARVIARAGAGIVVAPDDSQAFVTAAHRLRADSASRRALASAGRLYSRHAFDIDTIGERFLAILSDNSADLPVRDVIASPAPLAPLLADPTQPP